MEKMSSSFYVAGVTFENRQVFLEELEELLLKPHGTIEVDLVFEPDNPYDKNAIAVIVKGRHIGYVPKDINQDIAVLLKNNLIKKIWLDKVGRAGADKPLGAKIVYII